MTAQPVEWVLVIFYGLSAHRATYGRLAGTTYTKDYVQLSRQHNFTSDLDLLFPRAGSGAGSVDLTYKWPLGAAPGKLIFQSADRPHLAWETKLGTPAAWRMALSPSKIGPETIPGDPAHLSSKDADNELGLLGARGAGQPYLMAIKLRDEVNTLHLRTYLREPSKSFDWANLELTPSSIRELAQKTSHNKALAWSMIPSSGTAPSTKIIGAIGALSSSKDHKSVMDTLDAETGRRLTTYLMNPGHGLFFDPSRNHDAWLQAPKLSATINASKSALLKQLAERFPVGSQSDATAETLEISAEEFETFQKQIEDKNYEVPDSYATSKTRGSAQRAFSNAVKKNYGFRCAITGITTNDFLIASHIVPWSQDQSIRLDPSNGICLSVLMDRAFETGHLLIEDDLTVNVDWAKVGGDKTLKDQLAPYHGKKLTAPSQVPPRQEYLQRRREPIVSTN